MIRFLSKFLGQSQRDLTAQELLPILRYSFSKNDEGMQSLKALLGDNDAYARMVLFLQQVSLCSIHHRISIELPRYRSRRLLNQLNAIVFPTILLMGKLTTRDIAKLFEYTKSKIGSKLSLPSPVNTSFVGALASTLIFPEDRWQESPELSKLCEILGGYATVFWQQADNQLTEILTDRSNKQIANKGSSIVDAIHVNSSNSLEAVFEEYNYIIQRFGKKGEDWQLDMQSNFQKDGKRYDSFDIKLLKSNEELCIYFDVSKCFAE